MKITKKKIKGCACYGSNTIHNCFCSPFSNKDKKPLKQADVISSVCKKCKSKDSFKHIEREGYVCQNCGWTKLFAN